MCCGCGVKRAVRATVICANLAVHHDVAHALSARLTGFRLLHHRGVVAKLNFYDSHTAATVRALPGRCCRIAS
jgi:hypothetical protein